MEGGRLLGATRLEGARTSESGVQGFHGGRLLGPRESFPRVARLGAPQAQTSSIL